MNHVPKHGRASLALPNSQPLRRFCGVFALSAALTVTVFAGTGICRRRTSAAGRQWSRAGDELTWPRMQRDTSYGLDRNESRHFGVSAARLAHGSGAGRAGPAADAQASSIYRSNS